MIRRELAVFLVVGSLTVLVDFLAYRGLVHVRALGVDTAKATGFLAGTVFAYFANRLWTFGGRPHRTGSAGRFALLYLGTLGANVALNALVLRAFGGHAGDVTAAFLLATATSAALNFAGMKFFVFRPPANTPSP